MIPLTPTKSPRPLRTSESLDYSKQRLVEFPEIEKPSHCTKLNISSNLIAALPLLSEFTSIRVLDISHNKLTDLSPLSQLLTLRELDCSFNRITSIDFASDIPFLEVLRASHNRISSIQTCLAKSLIDIDLSSNEFSGLEFLQSKFPNTIERIDVSSNIFDEIFELRYISVFQNLRVLNVSLYEDNRDILIEEFVKQLCPSLEVFDGADVSQIPSDTFPISQLLDTLVNGNEAELRAMLASNVEKAISWEAPSFVEFSEEPIIPIPAPLKKLDARLQNIEMSIPEIRGKRKEIKKEKYKKIREELVEIQRELSNLSKILLVHDKALESLYQK